MHEDPKNEFNCNKIFSRNDSLSKHIETHHKIKSANGFIHSQEILKENKTFKCDHFPKIQQDHL